MSLIGKDVKKLVTEDSYKIDLYIKYGSAMLAVVVMGISFNVYLLGKIIKDSKFNKNCTECHNSKKHNMTNYFKKKGSPEPGVMADAVLQTRNPRLLAAIAIKESTGNYRIRNTGYKKRHSGAFQVANKYHGKVPFDAAGQALQAEAILKELVQEKGSIVKGLNSYGGDVSRKMYAKNILAELSKVPK